MSKIKNFLKINKEYFITSAITIAIVFLFYLIFGIFPFGSNTIGHYDMIAQIIPLSELFYDFTSGNSTLFYSTRVGMNSNTFGFLVYYILSPFNLILLLSGKGNIIFAVNLVFILRLICICCVAIWFIKKYFKKLNSIQIIILSLLYTFSGYMLFSYTFLSFLDYLIYIPLLVHFFINMKNGGKIFPLSIIIFFMILSCFSLGCFTLLYLMIIFIAYIFIYVEKENRKQLIIKTCCACLVSIGLSLWLMIPAFMQYLSSSRANGNALFKIPPFNAMPTRLGVAISEVISIIFATLFILKCDKKNKFNRFLITISILTLLTIICDEVMLMFNGGSIMGYYSRFGFVGAFLTLTLASKYLNEMFIKSNTKDKFLTFFAYAMLGLFSVVLIILVNIEIYNFKTQSLIWYGVLQLAILLLPIAFIVIYTLISKRHLGKHINYILLICTIILCFCNLYSHLSTGINDTKMFSSAKTLSQYTNNERVKLKTTSYLKFAYPISDLKAIDVFSSLVDEETITTLHQLGYHSNVNNANSYGGTVLSDIVVNNKYIISETKLNYSHLQLIKTTEAFYLYENTLCNNKALIINNETEFGDNLIENQQLIYEALGGTDNLFKKVEIKFTYENCEYNENTRQFANIDKNNASNICIENNYDDKTILYGYYKGDIEGNLQINNGFILSPFIFEVDKKEGYDIQFSNTLELNKFEFYTLDISKLENLINISYNITEVKDKLKLNINLENNSTIILPYINIDNYSVYVNGEKTKFSNKFDSFMTLDLQAGENCIEIKYNHPATKYFLIGIISGGFIIAIAYLILRYKDKFKDKFVNYTFTGFSYIYSFVMLLFPIVVMILKIFKVI